MRQEKKKLTTSRNTHICVKNLSGKLGWNQLIGEQFGLERWPRLKKALEAEPAQFCYHPSSGISVQTDTYNCSKDALEQQLIALGLEKTGIPNCYKSLKLTNIEQHLPLAYFLDGASCLAALLLDAKPGQTILDLCSAPGGKSLILSAALFEEDNELANNPATHKESLLVCNESSTSRLQRLKTNITRRVPKTAVSKGRIQFTNCAGSLSAIERYGPFDKILVDAPCSSDRHIIKTPVSMAQWHLRHVKNNSERQYDLVVKAIKLLKYSLESKILYCTCALSELENDKVIEKIITESNYSTIIEPIPHNDLLETFHIRYPSIRIYLNETNLQHQESIETMSCLNTTQQQTNQIKEYTMNTNDKEEKHDPHIFEVKAELTTYGIILLPDISKFGPLYICGLRYRNTY